MNTSPATNRTNIAGRGAPATSIGGLLRTWRERRRLSQLELAGAADISARHVSFLETGRSLPSREMLLRLAERLEVPLRERNALLLSAGYAPMYSERRLDDPALRQAQKAVEVVLAGHEPYPALAVDRHWNLVAANSAVPTLLVGVEPRLLQPPINVMRIGLHPQGFAPRVQNYQQWRGHLLARLRNQIDATADPVLVELLAELEAYPRPAALAGVGAERPDETEYGGVVVPMRVLTEHGMLSFFGTTTVFGTPLDITLAELAIESFFPADRATAELLAQVARSSRAKADGQA